MVNNVHALFDALENLLFACIRYAKAGQQSLCLSAGQPLMYKPVLSRKQNFWSIQRAACWVGTSWTIRIAMWLFYWAASFGIWLLLVNTTKAHELWMAAIAATFAATAAEIVRAQRLAPFRPKLSWLAEAWREPWYIVEGCASIFYAFIKHFFRPEPSVLRNVVFDPGGDDPASAARRALAVAFTTMPPNFVVLGIDIEHRVMLVHQVSESETPTMTRKLGARS